MGMNFDKAVELLEAGHAVNLECHEGWIYEVSQSENWIGGDSAEGYISLVLGNVIYDEADYILRKSMEFLSPFGETVIIKG